MKIPTVTIAFVKKLASDLDGYIKIATWVPGTNKPIYKPTGYKVPATSWDPINQQLINYPNHHIINKTLITEKEKLQALYTADLGKVQYTPTYIKNIISPSRVSGEFLTFYKEHLNYIEKKFSRKYYDHFLIEWKQFSKFAPGCNFADITTPLLEKYETTLRKYAQTTINTKAKRLKEVVDKAIAQGHITTKQIAGYKWPSYEKPDRPYLTLKQTNDLYNAIIKKEFDHHPGLKKVACYFLIECYSGIRFSDWHRFTVEKLIHNKALKVRAKKNGEPIYLPFNIFTRLGKICTYVQQNNITFNLAEATTNSLLSVISAHLKFGIHLTTHIGRHTCATLLAEMNYNNLEIAEVLGISPQTALTYIKSTKQGLRNTFKNKGGL